MSNRDPLYRETNHGDPFEAPTTGKRGESGGSSDQMGNKADEAKAKGQQVKDQATQKGQQAVDQASQKGQQAKQKASQAAGMAEERADQGMDKAASGLDQAADKVRQQGSQQGGSMGTAATKAADTMDSASSYLRSTDTDQIMNDLESMIRRKPTESLLAAAGVGFVLSKIFR